MSAGPMMSPMMGLIRRILTVPYSFRGPVTSAAVRRNMAGSFRSTGRGRRSRHRGQEKSAHSLCEQGWPASGEHAVGGPYECGASHAGLLSGVPALAGWYPGSDVNQPNRAAAQGGPWTWPRDYPGFRGPRPGTCRDGVRLLGCGATGRDNLRGAGGMARPQRAVVALL